MSQPPTVIHKAPRTGAKLPNLRCYEEAYASFRWDDARRELSGLPKGKGLNIAFEAVDRHALGARRDKIALKWCGKAGAIREITYRDLMTATSRFANLLRRLGVKEGDCVAVYAGRMPELYVACLGTLKAKCVFSPLFAAFGPEPLHTRLLLGRAKVLVTTARLYTRKVAGIRSRLPDLAHVLLIDEEPDAPLLPGTLDLATNLAEQSPDFDIPATSPEDRALLHFTSGTTGAPKGAIHVHDAVVAHHATGRLALDLSEDDVFWCTADPGWVTGTSYGIIAPLTCGATMIVDEGDFDAERWYGLLERQRVTVWYTAPTAVRMLMKAGDELPRGFDLGALRLIASVGEPLNPEAVLWGARALGRPIHDNWWQTETGGIMIANCWRGGWIPSA